MEGIVELFNQLTEHLRGAWDELDRYVNDCNAVATKALKDRKEALLTFHRLDVPATFNTTILSTNIIGNVIKNWRSHTRNVKLWKDKGDVVSRWVASGLLWSENTFKKIRHAEDLHLLAAALPFSIPAPVATAPCASTLKGKEELESNKKLMIKQVSEHYFWSLEF